MTDHGSQIIDHEVFVFSGGQDLWAGCTCGKFQQRIGRLPTVGRIQQAEVDHISEITKRNGTSNV